MSPREYIKNMAAKFTCPRFKISDTATGRVVFLMMTKNWRYGEQLA